MRPIPLFFFSFLLPFGPRRTGFASFAHPIPFAPAHTYCPLLTLLTLGRNWCVKTRSSRTAAGTFVHIYILLLVVEPRSSLLVTSAIYLLPVIRLVLSLVHFICLTTPTRHSNCLTHPSLLSRFLLAFCSDLLTFIASYLCNSSARAKIGHLVPQGHCNWKCVTLF